MCDDGISIAKRSLRVTTMLLFCCACFANGAPVSGQNKTGAAMKIPTKETFDFMKRFGYLAQGISNSEALYKESTIVEAIKNMQKFGALEQTGIIDNATLALMSARRCGVVDLSDEQRNKRQKRFIIGAKGWKKRTLTFFVANWHHSLGEKTVLDSVQKALDTWGAYARLKFRHVKSPSADIIIAFGSGYHGDSYAFDGKGSILAHAYYPYESGYYGGDAHFDNDEDWTNDMRANPEGVDFFTVALHELGHSLGLAHSPVSTSVMFPYYNGEANDGQLDYDDIYAMYELYIKRRLEEDDIDTPTVTEERRPETTTPRYRYEITEDPTSDEDTSDERYVPRRYPNREPTTERVYTPTTAVYPTFTYEGDDGDVDDHVRRFGGSKPNVTHVPNICKGNYDAVASIRNELFFFKDQYFWRLKELATIEKGYPAEIYQLFRGLPSSVRRIDAAYERQDGNIVLFTGNEYWVYDGNSFVDDSPRPLSDYHLPAYLTRVDAAQVWAKNNKLYLFGGELFWRYDQTTGRLDPGYPMEITKRWRGVPSDLDAAVTWRDGQTYFFKHDMYWRFDNLYIKTVDGYPLPSPEVWLGCPERFEEIWWRS